MAIEDFKRRRGGRLVIAAAVVAAIAVAGCGSSSSSSSSSAAASSSAASGSASASTPASTSTSGPALNQAASSFAASLDTLKGKKVAFLGCSTQITWCAKWNPSLNSDLTAAGAKVSEVNYQSQTNPALQVQQLQQAITQHPDAIIIQPLAEPALAPQLIRAKAAGIPVIFGGSVIAPSLLKQGLATTAVSVDHYKDGYFAAQALIRGMKAAGKTGGNVIMISGNPADGGSTLSRIAGFKAGLATAPSYKLVAMANSNWDPTTAAQVTGPLLAKYASNGGVAGIYGISGYVAVGAIQAAKQAGSPIGVAKKGIVFVGGNCSATSIKALKNGELYADFTEIPTEEATITAKATAAALAKQKLPNVLTPTLNEITPQNVNTYAARCNY